MVYYTNTTYTICDLCDYLNDDRRKIFILCLKKQKELQAQIFFSLFQALIKTSLMCSWNACLASFSSATLTFYTNTGLCVIMKFQVLMLLPSFSCDYLL